MKKIRALHPFTQPQLAEYLLISRDQVAQYEAGKQRLPPKAREKLARLEIALANNSRLLTTAAEIHLRQIEEKEQQPLEWELTELQYRLHLTTSKLDSIAKKYDKAMQALWTIQVLLQQLSPGKEGVYEKKWLQATEAGILKKLRLYSPGKQQLLQLRKTILQKQVDGIQALLDAYQNKKIKKRRKTLKTST